MQRAVIPEILLSIYGSMNALNSWNIHKTSAFYTQVVKKDLFLPYHSLN